MRIDYKGSDRAISIEKAFTVRDLMEPVGSFNMTLVTGRIIALDGFDGKRLFDTRKNKKEHIHKYYNARVTKLWTEIKSETSGYRCSAEPVIMLYLDHNTLNDERERPVAVPFDFLRSHQCKYNDGRLMYPHSTIEVDVSVQTIEDYLQSIGFDDVDYIEAMGYGIDKRRTRSQSKGGKR